MADSINIPSRKRSSGLSNLFGIAGGVIGAAGGPAGALSGASLGKGIGDAVTPATPPGPEAIQTSGAMDKRMQQLNNSNIRQIAQGIDSLQYIQDPEQRMALAKPLLKADYLARKGKV